MDFTRFSKQFESKPPVERPTKVVYHDNIFYANLRGRLIPIDEESLSCKGYTNLYSRIPENDWKKSTILNPIMDDERLKKINVSWSPIKPGLIVRGKIINGKYHVSSVDENPVKG